MLQRVGTKAEQTFYIQYSELGLSIKQAFNVSQRVDNSKLVASAFAINP